MWRIFSSVLCFRAIIVTIIQIVLLSACSQVQVLSPKFLFHLPLGTLPGEFEYWNSHKQTTLNNDLVIREGIFYVVNGDRILKLSSNGFLLDMIGNYHLLNKGSVSQSSTIFDDSISFFSYSLNSVKNLAVDSNQRMIIAHLHHGDNQYLSFNNEVFDRVQLLVYANNTIAYNVVREGDIRNFVSARGLFVKDNNEIVLVSQEKLEFTTYFFDADGRFLQKITIPSNEYPQYKNATDKSTGEIFGVIKSIIPSKRTPYLYVQFDFHNVEYDNSQETITSVSFFDSKIYRINIHTGKYDRVINLTATKTSGVELVGILADETLVLMNYIDNNIKDLSESIHNLMVFFLTPTGQIKKQYHLVMPDINIFDMEFAIDEQGRVGALFFLKDRVEVYWWSR